MIRTAALILAGYCVSAALTPQIGLDLRETDWLNLGTYTLIACGVLIVYGIERGLIYLWIRVMVWHINRMADRYPDSIEWKARRLTANVFYGKGKKG